MRLFEILFKYKPIVYEKGHLAFQLLGSPWLYIPFAILAAAGAFYAYRNVASDKRHPGMIVLRGLTFANTRISGSKARVSVPRRSRVCGFGASAYARRPV